MHEAVLRTSSTAALAAGMFLFLAGSGVSGGVTAQAPGLNGSSYRTFHLRDFGAVSDGKTESGEAIRSAIQAALAGGPGTEVILESGTYHVKPPAPREACFSIHGATNLVVRGAGKTTRILITDPAAGGFSFSLGQQVSLRDLTIDYDPVPFCQGTIRTVDVKAGSFDLEVEAGYPTPDAENFVKAMEPYGKWGMIMDRGLRRIRSGTPDHYMTPRWESQGGRVWRFFTLDEHYRRNLEHMRAGDAYVHLARGNGSAIFAQGCDGFRIENVVVHASPGLAVGLVGNRGEILVRGLEVRFAPGTTRLLTANADGVHCQQNRAGPIIEQCYFEGMADDAINLYAPPNVLLEMRSPAQWLVSPGSLILPGDRLQVLDPKTGRIRGEVKALEVKPERGELVLTLDKPLEGAVAGADHRSGDTLYNLDACGAGFQIRRNRMVGNRRYGCLLRAGGGTVEDNIFEDTTGAGVVLTNEPDWPEGPVPWDVTIRRNRFLRGGTCLGYADSPEGAALIVRATRLGHGLAETEAIRKVTIEDNEFTDRAGAAVFLGGVKDVTFKGNRIKAATGAELRRQGAAISVERSSGVALLDNTVADPRPGTLQTVEIGPNVVSGEMGVRISGLNARLAPGATNVLDHRPPLNGELQIHDPSTIMKCVDNYWVFGTGMGIISRVSRDLMNWTEGPRVFAQAPAWTTEVNPHSLGKFWAPDLVHSHGQYLLYYSVSSWGSRESAIGLARSPTLDPKAPDYGWSDAGIVVRTSNSDDHNAIDPSVLLDRDDRLWLAFGSYWSGIKLVELNPKTGLCLTTNAPIYSLAWNGSIEAACLHQRGDSYYLFVNWGQCCRGTNSTYEIRMGRSRSVTGPYLDRDGKDMLQGGGSLLLATDDHRIGPGHAGILSIGGQDFLSYHFYNAREHGRAELGITTLKWRADGWPEVVSPLHAGE